MAPLCKCPFSALHGVLLIYWHVNKVFVVVVDDDDDDGDCDVGVVDGGDGDGDGDGDDGNDGGGDDDVVVVVVVDDDDDDDDDDIVCTLTIFYKVLPFIPYLPMKNTVCNSFNIFESVNLTTQALGTIRIKHFKEREFDHGNWVSPTSISFAL